VAVEDCDTLGGDAAAETALFHLHNLLAERGGALLLTAAVGPRDWGLALPDLASRVQAAGLVRLEPPDDALLSALLLKQFADRQISVSPALVDWLVPRMHRSGAEVRRIVSALDARGLAEKRPVTRALAQDMRDLLVAGPADAS
jgi:chromosomal replication initiation ATPase DnaA